MKGTHLAVVAHGINPKAILPALGPFAAWIKSEFAPWMQYHRLTIRNLASYKGARSGSKLYDWMALPAELGDMWGPTPCTAVLLASDRRLAPYEARELADSVIARLRGWVRAEHCFRYVPVGGTVTNVPMPVECVFPTLAHTTELAADSPGLAVVAVRGRK